MDYKKFADLVGETIETLVKPHPGEIAELLTDAELLAEVRERGLILSPEVGGVALDGAEVDKRTSLADVKEGIRDQLDTSREGYKAVLKSLNEGRRTVHGFESVTTDQLTAEFDTWMTDEKAAYVRQAQAADPDLRFTLVITPNVFATAADISRIAQNFSQQLEYDTRVNDRFIAGYDEASLSGTDPTNGKKVQFSLIPSDYTRELNGTAAEQREKFAEIKREYPHLKVPSVLEAMVYWETLGKQDFKLVDKHIIDHTHISHFDLSEQLDGGQMCILFTGIYESGEPFVYNSAANSSSFTRIAVG